MSSTNIKELFTIERFGIHGFLFTISNTNYMGLEKRVHHTEIGVDDANSKGYIVEITSDGAYTVYNVETKNRVEVVNAQPWDYDDLVMLLRKYGSITGDVRDIPA